MPRLLCAIEIAFVSIICCIYYIYIYSHRHLIKYISYNGITLEFDDCWSNTLKHDSGSKKPPSPTI